MRAASPRRVLVYGCGVIGTSVGLALRRARVHVSLEDVDPAARAQAERAGAGVRHRPGDVPADVVVIATPPATIAPLLYQAQVRGLGAAYTDVASVKSRIVAEAELIGCDLSTYVPGHPLAGRELSGPAAADVDLFARRPWVLCPNPATRFPTLRAAWGVAAACGGEVQLLDADEHDRLLAATSHAPHVVSAAMAARFARADDATLSMIGRGLFDTTRIAGGSHTLWSEILEHNAGSVADVLEAVASDLAAVTRALRARSPASDSVSNLLHRGNVGRRHIVAAEDR